MRTLAWTSTSATAFLQRRIRTIRAITYLGAVLSVVGVGIWLIVSGAAPEEAIVLATMGGTLAGTPYILTRALEEVLNDRSDASRQSGGAQTGERVRVV